MDLDDLRHVRADQSGIVARRQLLEAGAGPADLRRWLRRRELVMVHPGVYVDHTGPLDWDARAWAAVQLYWPAALVLDSALGLETDPIHVGVEAARSFRSHAEGVRVHRLRELERRVQWTRSPPRQRYEDALLGRVNLLDDRDQVVEAVSEACRTRRTTPERLAAELARRPAQRDRLWLASVLVDAGRGVHSVLERAYVTRVEQPHALPTPQRQARAVGAGGRVAYRDGLWEEYGVALELDGRVGHESARGRLDDMDRDLEAAMGSVLTIRLGWRHVTAHPCRTAVRVGSVLSSRGWPGLVLPCGPECSVPSPRTRVPRGDARRHR